MLTTLKSRDLSKGGRVAWLEGNVAILILVHQEEKRKEASSGILPLADAKVHITE